MQNSDPRTKSCDPVVINWEELSRTCFLGFFLVFLCDISSLPVTQVFKGEGRGRPEHKLLAPRVFSIAFILKYSRNMHGI
jgi:hypothetical protein